MTIVSTSVSRTDKSNRLTRSALSFERLVFDKLQDIPCWVAGGALRDYFSATYDFNDIDIYFASEENFKLAEELVNGMEDAVFMSENTNSIKYGLSDSGIVFDLVKIIFANPVECLEAFDFTISCSAIELDENNTFTFHHHEDFFMDLAAKKLAISGTRVYNPLSSLVKMQKYNRRGFTADAWTLRKLCKQIEDPKGTRVYESASFDAESVMEDEPGFTRVRSFRASERSPFQYPANNTTATTTP